MTEKTPQSTELAVQQLECHGPCVTVQLPFREPRLGEKYLGFKGKRVLIAGCNGMPKHRGPRLILEEIGPSAL